MISAQNPDVDVDALMERVRAEVAAMRALSASHQTARSVLGDDGRLPPVVIDLSRHAVVTELIEDAARMSKPRTAVPRRLERAPFSLARRLVRFGLRVLNYTQKDQRHVNLASQQALREVLQLAVAIGNHVAQLAAVLQEQRNTPRDLASLAARITASEQREAAFFERFAGLDESVEARLLAVSERVEAGLLAVSERVEPRITALEDAMTTNARRIDELEAGRFSPRLEALEQALTVNARRIDELEAGRLTPRLEALEQASTVDARRIDAVEHALTLNAGRIDTLENKPFDARLLGLETANTIAAQRLERLEGFREETLRWTTLLDETRRDLGLERERALRSEAGLRMELTAQLNTARALASRSTPAPEDVAAAPSLANVDAAPSQLSAERYDELHLAIADRFRGDGVAMAVALERYVDIVRDAQTVDAEHQLVDIGCGRGEWLAVLAAAGVSAFGLDLNALLVARAREEGLDARRGDALAVLRETPSESLGAITALHVIEHLTFEQMIALFDESLRVLIPGGLLICETPNPANVTIGACNFYLDPTHRRPLPSLLVTHIMTLRGFTAVRVDELAANDDMRIAEETETARRVNDFFYGSQNYAVVARKPGLSR